MNPDETSLRQHLLQLQNALSTADLNRAASEIERALCKGAVGRITGFCKRGLIRPIPLGDSSSLHPPEPYTSGNALDRRRVNETPADREHCKWATMIAASGTGGRCGRVLWVRWLRWVRSRAAGCDGAAGAIGCGRCGAIRCGRVRSGASKCGQARGAPGQARSGAFRGWLCDVPAAVDGGPSRSL
jgi:hypothetical protein